MGSTVMVNWFPRMVSRRIRLGFWGWAWGPLTTHSTPSAVLSNSHKRKKWAWGLKVSSFLVVLTLLQQSNSESDSSELAGLCGLSPDEKEAEQGLALLKPDSPPLPGRCCELAESEGQGTRLDLIPDSFSPSDYNTLGSTVAGKRMTPVAMMLVTT